MTTHISGARDSRTEPLVAALVEEGLVPPARRNEAVDVVDRVLGSLSTPVTGLRRRFAELAGYLGGALVVSAVGIFLGTEWDTLSAGEQAGLLALVAVLLAGVALALGAAVGGGLRAIRRGEDAVRRRLTGALLTGAAVSAGGAVGVLVDDVFPRTDTAPMLAGFATIAVLSLVGYLVSPTVVGQLGVAAGTVTAASTGIGELGGTSTGIGLGVLGLGVLWLLASERGLWRETASARALGCGLAVAGAQIPALGFDGHRWVGYLALALVAVAGFAGYVVRPAWPYLAAGVVAVTLVVPEALLDWTDSSLGPAGALLAAGLTLLLAALLGLRLRREAGEGATGLS